MDARCTWHDEPTAPKLAPLCPHSQARMDPLGGKRNILYNVEGPGTLYGEINVKYPQFKKSYCY